MVLCATEHTICGSVRFSFNTVWERLAMRMIKRPVRLSSWVSSRAAKAALSGFFCVFCCWKSQQKLVCLYYYSVQSKRRLLIFIVIMWDEALCCIFNKKQQYFLCETAAASDLLLLCDNCILLPMPSASVDDFINQICDYRQNVHVEWGALWL